MDDLSDADLLHGYGEIGRFLNLSERQAKHRAAAFGMPIIRMGKSVSARRASLRAWLAEQEQAAQRAPAKP